VTAHDLIYPIFVEEGIDEKLPIASMPGVMRIPEAALERRGRGNRAADGVRALMLFGVSHHKDGAGSDSWQRDGLLARMVAQVEARGAGHGDHPRYLLLRIHRSRPIAATIEHGNVANDVTIENLGRQAVVAIEAGADMVAPSAMMDRPGRGDPPRGSTRRPCRRRPIMAYSSEIRLVVLRAVPRRLGLRPGRRPQDLSDRPAQRPRGAARIGDRRGERR